jgi:molecular chaperone DnaK (HSP70)
MAEPRFSIGIDLGTSNSALAFAPLNGAAPAEIFPIPQWDTASTMTEAPTLPSFLYLTEEAAGTGDGQAPGQWQVGRLARRRAAETPGRVAQSAKSWLCHHAADRLSPFLPWGSDELPRDRKISPVHASALILNHLRSAWDGRFARAGAGFAFDAQAITITVPASFDAAAQRLTLAAAADAGFPDHVRLLEEPQAAFYGWLEGHDPGRDLWAHIPDPEAPRHHVLVIDIGGGTSDFSLFEIGPGDPGTGPRIRRIAVSDHILLGGDNIDLAIAHRLEVQLASGEGRLSGLDWDHLVARCRDLKEKALAAPGMADESFQVSLPGRGSNLIAAAMSARMSRSELEDLLLEGFFPPCKATARPERVRAALKEWGLPYAADSAVTRHLAAFLNERPPVDAVLFNGGTLYPERLRRRLADQIGAWQNGAAPLILENTNLDLAVARGAAHFGRLVHQRANRIDAGAARAIFLETFRPGKDGSGDGRRSLLCILPRGAPPGEAFAITDRALELRLNRPVRFQAYSSTRHGKVRAGDIVDGQPEDFQPLPHLETIAKIEDEGGTERTLPVALDARLTELGLLQVSCRSLDRGIERSWPLEFNLRPHEQGDLDRTGSKAIARPLPDANAPAEARLEAGARIRAVFNPTSGRREKVTAARLFQGLERILGRPKGEWNGVLIRSLWPSLEASEAGRGLSAEHEEAWLIVAGFLLRPGFGAPLDADRIDGLWRIVSRGARFPGKRIRLQEYILWRRVAGGLSREQQERLIAPELDRVRRQANLPDELVRLAGSLERIGLEVKTDLIDRFIAVAGDLARARQHPAPYLSALGWLLNRAPLYAGPECVVSPEWVETAFEAFSRLDWKDPELAELAPLFLRAARLVGDRTVDVAGSVRSRIASRLEGAGVSPAKVARLRQAMPIERAERAGLFGEALPPGLILSE